jgi:hypothetical protein
MNADQLAKLVADLVATWPTGVRGRIWTRELGALELDATRARAVYQRLTDLDDRPPSVARFRAVYDSLAPFVADLPTPEHTGAVISPADAYERIPELAAWRARR